MASDRSNHHQSALNSMASTEIEARIAALVARELECTRKHRELEARERAVAKRETDIAARERAVAKRQADADNREASLRMRAVELDKQRQKAEIEQAKLATSTNELAQLRDDMVQLRMELREDRVILEQARAELHEDRAIIAQARASAAKEFAALDEMREEAEQTMAALDDIRQKAEKAQGSLMEWMARASQTDSSLTGHIDQLTTQLESQPSHPNIEAQISDTCTAVQSLKHDIAQVMAGLVRVQWTQNVRGKDIDRIRAAVRQGVTTTRDTRCEVLAAIETLTMDMKAELMPIFTSMMNVGIPDPNNPRKRRFIQ
ncbi:hypothetical protein VTJ49DRAFT_1149 [Mycothermus thermophilus]|uniref:Uncharacterized protein n=1 Tax=Humicola insolens TaxID=85995 RepID=A0ABR3VRB5_HUMIN